ncbi:hypothetical protein ABT297_32430 [Dactylosporangium sp. NPDC000555]|uniref:CBS domain-containing protein n=1 Tax=Dactylosporangium sp. NPDC000555 TaxID=3154260 RepID=UPI00332B3FAE
MLEASIRSDGAAGVVTVGADAGLQQVVDAVEGAGARAVAVVDGSGRLVGMVDPGAYPQLFGADGPRRPGALPAPRQRRRRDRIGDATARDLMTPAAEPHAGSKQRSRRMR